MTTQRLRTSVALSSQLYSDPWRTSSERIAQDRAKRYAMLMRMREQELAKPPRNRSYDGDIAKRRDKS